MELPNNVQHPINMRKSGSNEDEGNTKELLDIAVRIQIQIQNSLFSTQHIVHTTMLLAYDVLKRERAEDSAYVGSFPNIII